MRAVQPIILSDGTVLHCMNCNHLDAWSKCPQCACIINGDIYCNIGYMIMIHLFNYLLRKHCELCDRHMLRRNRAYCCTVYIYDVVTACSC
jgi:hypothetical protein